MEASEEMIKAATDDSIPSVPYLFWSFRIMVAFGFYMLVLFGLAFYYNAKRVVEQKRWLLRILVWSIPVPWLACELGWIVPNMAVSLGQSVRSFRPSLQPQA